MSHKAEGSASDTIPLLDLERQHRPLASELSAALERVSDEQAFVLGETVANFEAAVADYIGAAHAVGVANGTDALYLSLRLVDLQPGDEVITTPFTFFATAGAIHNAGAHPVFVDIEAGTFNLDSAAAAAAVSDRTRAIIPVHLFGQMADLEPLRAVAAEREIMMIEDAAQAIGARGVVDGQWRRAGTVGHTGCFSFYPTKNLGGWGDGGMVVTDDDGLAARLRSLRVHGQRRGLGSYRHDEVGINSRLDSLQAAVLQVKLPRLAGWNEARRAHAAFYDRALADVEEVATPAARADRFHVYHLYTVRAQRRDELRAFLADRGIGSGIYYATPLHLQPCFASLGYGTGDFPEAERAAAEVLSLPIFPELTTSEKERVAEAIRSFYAAG